MQTENLKMAGSPLRVLERMSIALSKCTIQDINFRPKQVLCFMRLRIHKKCYKDLRLRILGLVSHVTIVTRLAT